MKLKTKKSAAKRFSLSASGKVKFKQTHKRHHLSQKSSSRKMRLRKGSYLFEGDQKLIRKCIPYGMR